jgi:hypothetical protein
LRLLLNEAVEWQADDPSVDDCLAMALAVPQRHREAWKAAKPFIEDIEE